jgi:hypothetical protein
MHYTLSMKEEEMFQFRAYNTNICFPVPQAKTKVNTPQSWNSYRTGKLTKEMAKNEM